MAKRTSTIRLTIGVIAIFFGCQFSTSVIAQDRDPTEPYPIKGMRTISPEIMQLDLPDGEVRLPGEIDRVATHDEDNKPVIARVHCLIGQNFVVMLPNGHLVGRKRDEVQATEKPFVPATHKEIAAAIMEEYDMRGFQVMSTENFVLVYSTSEEFAKVTAKVMETMLEGIIKFTAAQGLKPHKPEIPLPIIAFRSAEQFQAYRPMPMGIAAYYEMPSNRVILKEESQMAGSGRVDLEQQELLSTIAHEGCHQLLHNIGVQQRLSKWPMWLGEGIAEYMAPTKPGRKFAWKGAGKINDMRMYELEVFMQKQFIKGFKGDTVDKMVSAGRLDSTGYAGAWTLTHYLAENHEESFNRYMRYLSRLAPMHGLLPEDLRDPEATVDANMIHFKKFFGEDLEQIENEMVNYMRREKYVSPVETYPHIVGLAEVELEGKPQRYACFFLFEEDLNEWAMMLKESLPEFEARQLKIRVGQFPNRGAANKAIRDFKRGKKRGR